MSFADQNSTRFHEAGADGTCHLSALESVQLYRRCLMAVSKQDRNDYEEGVRDSKKGVIEQAINDIPSNHPDNEAYYKGRKGEKLDDDKK
jgi:hypothetical protein